MEASTAVIPSSLRDRDGFRHALRVLASGWWFAGCCALVGGVLALFLSLLQTPIYQSSATLYVTSAGDANAQSAYQGSLASQQRVSSYAKLATSDSVVSRALAQSGIDMRLDSAKSVLSSTASIDTVLLTISARDPDPDVAAGLANAVADSLTGYVSSLEQPVAGGVPLAKLTVVTPASAVHSPISPLTKRNTVLGLVTGMLIGFLVVILRDRLNDRVSTGQQVEEVLGKPVLGTIPDDEDLSGGSVLDFSVGSSPAAEAYRKMRTNLEFVGVDHSVRSILVTSPGPGEGKTTTALNLAAALAETGPSVLLVDADLRKPTVADRVRVTGSLGLTDLLTGRVRPDEVIQTSGIRNVDVLASGPIPPNPAELLGSSSAERVFGELSKSYSFIIVDSPPMLPVTDAVVLSRLVNGILIVVRSCETRLPALASVADELRAVGASALGAVVNGTDGGLGYYESSYYGWPHVSKRDGEEFASRASRSSGSGH